MLKIVVKHYTSDYKELIIEVDGTVITTALTSEEQINRAIEEFDATAVDLNKGR